MEYRHKWNQFFRKKLNLPKKVLSRVYNDKLSLREYIQYELYGKIPVTCIFEPDRKLLDKFGLERVLSLDWELLNQSFDHRVDLDLMKILLEEIPAETEDINKALYERVVDIIPPDNFSSKMIPLYPDKVFEITEQDKGNVYYYKRKFNEGKLTLEEIVSNWELLKEKDLSYCLSNDYDNTFGLGDKEVKEFINTFSSLIPLISEHDDLYKFISQYTTLKTQGEKNNYIKRFTDNLLELSEKKDPWTGQQHFYDNEEYRIIFRYSSLDDYLKSVDEYYGGLIAKELHELSPEYIFNIDFPFEIFTTRNNLAFIAIYGLKNVVDFDNECGKFFSKKDCLMLKNMYEMYIHYGNNINDPEQTIYTKKSYDENGNYVERGYTKDEFYEAMRRMIVYGPTNGNYRDSAPNYKDMTGEFRERFSELFIPEDAPEELQKAFYTKTVTPKLIKNNPNFIPLLKGKEIKSFFVKQYVQLQQGYYYTHENIYDFLSKKVGYDETMQFIVDYADVLEMLFSEWVYDSRGEIRIPENPTFDDIKRAVCIACKNTIVDKGVPYPKDIPASFRELMPAMFLPTTTPKHIQEAFYSRTLKSEDVFELEDYKKYFKDIDLDMIAKPMTIWEKGTKGNREISFQGMIKERFGEDGIEIILRYGEYLEKAYKENNLLYFEYDKNKSNEDVLNEIDKEVYNLIIDGKTKYTKHMSEHFKNAHPTLFLGNNVPQEIQDKFYNREFTIEDFENNYELLNLFGETNIICGMSEQYSWLIPVFSQNENQIEANQNRIKVLNTFMEIEDVTLQGAFKEYMAECVDEIDIEKIGYMAEVLHRLASSNSSEMFMFRKQLAVQILASDDPIASLDKIEGIFVKNNIPTIGKIYSCFEILHPNFEGFRFENSRISPVLTQSSNTARKTTVFSDLIRASFGSNNRSVNNYLNNLQIGNTLYEQIVSGKIKITDLSQADLKELETFRSHLATMYNNTQAGKKDLNGFDFSNDIIKDINELKRLLSPNGTLDYDLADRVVNMFCHFAGFETLEEAQNYIKNKIQTAEQRNIEASKQDMKLEEGDYIKGIAGGLLYLGSILQNGSLSREYLGASAGSDATPLDTDVSRIMSSDGTNKDKIFKTEAYSYGDIYFVLKGDDRFLTTRDETGERDVRRDKDKLEVFKTGVVGGGHYGIRTGFSSSDINYIVVTNYDEKVALEVTMNGFYIPIVDLDGKVVFSYEDYQNLRQKMNGLKHYGQTTYEFSDNLVIPETQELASQIEESNIEVREKREKINKLITSALEEVGLKLKTSIDGDLTEGYAELIDTGSTGRGTNKPGDGDFDFIMRLDRKILSNPQKINELKNALLKRLGSGINTTTNSGDFRLKDVFIEPTTKVDIDITFVEKTDQVSYSTDMCLQDRLQTIYETDPVKYSYVVANILLAKRVLKEANAYKPHRSDASQGGMGGVGIENWVLQHGGSFIDAAKSFVEAAEGLTYDQFKDKYRVWDFGENHLAAKKGNYPHDNFIFANMNEAGFKKTKEALKKYLLTYNQVKTNTIKR